MLLSGLSATVTRQAAHMLVPGGFYSNSLWWRSQLHIRIIKVQPANPKPSVAFMWYTAPSHPRVHSIVSDLFTVYIYLINALKRLFVF